jgi:hypothetical protein
MATNEDDMEELTLSQIAKEFHINRGTLNNWVYRGRIPARKEFSDLGIQYYLIRRGEITKFLQNRRKFGRPLRRT